MSIDIDKVRKMLAEDSSTLWEETGESIRPYVGEMEVVEAVKRIMWDLDAPYQSVLTVRRLLVTLISAESGGRDDRGYVVWHKHDGDSVRLVPIPEEVEAKNPMVQAWIPKETE